MITRQFLQIIIDITPGSGDPVVRGFALTTDDVENTATGVARDFKAPVILADAAKLRDDIMALAANAGKPLTFTPAVSTVV